MYEIYCNVYGFFIRSRALTPSLEESGFELEYDINMPNMPDDYRYAGVGYYRGIPFMISGGQLNYYELIWLNCTPREAYNKALDLDLINQSRLSYLLKWKREITDAMLLTFLEDLFYVRSPINKQLKEQIVDWSIEVIRDYYEHKTGRLIIKARY